MAPENGNAAPGDDKKPTKGVDTSKAEAALQARLSRKRTKTGCLTCRKRRIKCGEERPVCKNCIKSKRLCEGYNQRVVYKGPTFDYQPVPNGGAHITFLADSMGSMPMHQGQVPQYMLDGTPYATLQPQPVGHYHPQTVQADGQHHMLPQQTELRDQSTQALPYAGYAVPVEQHVAYPYQAQLHAQQQGQTPYAAATFEQAIAQMNQGQSMVGHGMPPQAAAFYSHHQNSNNGVPTTSTAEASAWSTAVQPNAPAAQQAQNPTVSPESPTRRYTFTQTPVNHGDARSWTMPTYTPRPELSRPIDQYQHFAINGSSSSFYGAADVKAEQLDEAKADFYHFQQPLPAQQSSTELLSEAAVERQDDDYYDVESDDEEMDTGQKFIVGKDFTRTRTLSAIFMRDHFDTQNMQMRRFDTFIQSGMLDHYRVEQVANPLKNPATARVFAHFISATGPSLMTFDRHSVSSSVLFSEEAVPTSRQGLWTYILPMKALHHQGLLHAMLAMASLHIARLEGASVTPSMQHYAWALKHIHKCVVSPNKKKRLAVTTIAASMLLGFYEIMTADHMKWNTHLMGAKQLFVETDFANMTRQFRRMKQEKAAMEQMYGRRTSVSLHLGGFLDDDGGLDQVNDVEDDVISQLVGREVRYDQQGHIEDPQSGLPQELDLKKFEILKDLYWWYCKQDAYQSIVSGNPLL